MKGHYGRNSLNTMSENTLKLNYFANGESKWAKSCLNEKTSFNFKLKEKYKSLSDLEKKTNFENLAKKIFEKGIRNSEDDKNDNKKKSIKDISFRINTMFKNFLSEYRRDPNQGVVVDGVTFKIFRNSKKKYR